MSTEWFEIPFKHFLGFLEKSIYFCSKNNMTINIEKMSVVHEVVCFKYIIVINISTSYIVIPYIYLN